MKTLLACLCATAAALAAAGWAAETEGPAAVVSVDPVGLLLFGPSLNAEFAVGDGLGLDVGVRPLTWGATAVAVARARDYAIERGLLFGAALRFYPRAAERLRGWYVGPRVEGGSVVAGEADTWAAFLQADAGYRWLRSRWAWAAGAQAGMAAGWYKNTTPADPSTEFYPVGQIGFSVGLAF